MRPLLALLLLVHCVGCFDDSEAPNLCRTDLDCDRGRVCGESPIEPGRLICMSACIADEECAEGEACMFGRCQPRPPTGDLGPDMMSVPDLGAADAMFDGGEDGFAPPGDASLDLAMPDLALGDGSLDEGPDGELSPDLGAFDGQAPRVDGSIDDDLGLPGDVDAGR